MFCDFDVISFYSAVMAKKVSFLAGLTASCCVIQSVQQSLEGAAGPEVARYSRFYCNNADQTVEAYCTYCSA